MSYPPEDRARLFVGLERGRQRSLGVRMDPNAKVRVPERNRLTVLGGNGQRLPVRNWLIVPS